MDIEIIGLVYSMIGLALFLLVVKRVFNEFSFGDVLFLLFVCLFFWPAMLGGAVYQIIKGYRE